MKYLFIIVLSSFSFITCAQDLMTQECEIEAQEYARARGRELEPTPVEQSEAMQRPGGMAALLFASRQFNMSWAAGGRRGYIQNCVKAAKLEQSKQSETSKRNGKTLVEDLLKLQQLYEQGLLTDAEFNIAKRRLLEIN
jgi:hypothetical protein